MLRVLLMGLFLGCPAVLMGGSWEWLIVGIVAAWLVIPSDRSRQGPLPEWIDDGKRGRVISTDW